MVSTVSAINSTLGRNVKAREDFAMRSGFAASVLSSISFARVSCIPDTVFLRIDAAAFTGISLVSLVRRLFEGGDYSRAAFILLGNMTRAAYPGSAHSTQPKFCQQAGKTF